MASRVLLVTGSLISIGRPRILTELRKQVQQYRASSRSALDLKTKLTPTRLFIAASMERKRGGDEAWRAAVEDYFQHDLEAVTPTLTQIVLATELERVGLAFTEVTYGELFADPELREELLDEHDCLLLSTTLLRDMSELEPVVAMLARPDNHIVLGGALIGIVHERWSPLAGVDMIAIGYGEHVMSGIAEWIRSGYRQVPASDGYEVGSIAAPAGGEATIVLHGHRPDGRSLDHLATPDWAAWSRRTGQPARMVRYESVRGCPYRCGFCNFPFLFDDTTFRTKSAKRIADEWEYYVKELGVEYVSCFDSLFTVPRKRIRELCDELIRRKLDLSWICYARGDDLVVDGMLERMRDAGLVQVHIGAESGSQQVLDSMNKRCSVEMNHDAVVRCRELGISTITTMMVGYPGETADTAEETYRFLAESRPDFYLLVVLNTRMEGVPMLEPEERARTGLVHQNDGRTNQPYFRHATMDAAEAAQIVEDIDERVRAGGHSLWAPVFHAGAPEYRLEQRGALTAYQHRFSESHPVLQRIFGSAHRWADRRIAEQIQTALPDPELAATPA